MISGYHLKKFKKTKKHIHHPESSESMDFSSYSSSGLDSVLAPEYEHVQCRPSFFYKGLKHPGTDIIGVHNSGMTPSLTTEGHIVHALISTWVTSYPS